MELRMSSTNVFKRIAGRQHRWRQQTVDNFREFVAAIELGQEPDPEAIERNLTDAGK